MVVNRQRQKNTTSVLVASSQTHFWLLRRQPFPASSVVSFPGLLIMAGPRNFPRHVARRGVASGTSNGEGVQGARPGQSSTLAPLLPSQLLTPGAQNACYFLTGI